MNSQLIQHWAKISRILDFRSRRESEAIRLLRNRYYRDYWLNMARLLHADIEDLGQEYYRIRRNGKQTYVKGYFVQIDDHVALKIAGNKSLSQKLLYDSGLPVANHRTCDLGNMRRAYEFLDNSDRPLVLKPATGSGGAGVTTGITSCEMLRRAATRASAISSNFFVEEQIEGDNYRLLYIAGKLVDIIRRNRPTVIGDGKQNITQLIVEENRLRLLGHPYTSLSILTDDYDVKIFLKDKQLSHNYVPKKGEFAVVKGVSNQNSARDNYRITDEIHPSFQHLGKQVQSVIDIRLLGIDIMTPSLNQSLEESGGGINEVNTTPAFHHHDLIHETEQECHAGLLAIEYIFGM